MLMFKDDDLWAPVIPWDYVRTNRKAGQRVPWDDLAQQISNDKWSGDGDELKQLYRVHMASLRGPNKKKWGLTFADPLNPASWRHYLKHDWCA
jgi:hypothetical protein